MKEKKNNGHKDGLEKEIFLWARYISLFIFITATIIFPVPLPVVLLLFSVAVINFYSPRPNESSAAVKNRISRGISF